eukprot:12906875-Alexandrium_andersonii.AAC.1
MGHVVKYENNPHMRARMGSPPPALRARGEGGMLNEHRCTKCSARADTCESAHERMSQRAR